MAVLESMKNGIAFNILLEISRQSISALGNLSRRSRILAFEAYLIPVFEAILSVIGQFASHTKHDLKHAKVCYLLIFYPIFSLLELVYDLCFICYLTKTRCHLL